MDRNLRVLEYNKIIDRIASMSSSSLGKEKIMEIRPSSSLEEIMILQKFTSEMTSILISKGHFPFGPLFDLKKEIKIAEIGSVLNPKQLLQVGDSLRTTRNVHRFINNIEDSSEKYPRIFQMVQMLTPLKRIEDEINNAIISEEQISDNASPELRIIRRNIERKQAAIRSKLDTYTGSSQMSKYLQDSIVTIRNNRFVIPVKAEHKSIVKGMVHDQSASGSTVFIEPMAIVELNNQLNQFKIDEVREIERILSVLTGHVGENGSAIRTNFEILTEIDVILAKGKYSLEISGISPEISKDKFLKIKSGRHPLLDSKSVVPLDIEIGKGYKSLIITGPNTGGKTVTLKTVGLFALMFQSGFHIPAKFGSSMPVFNNIYADIGDEQSIEQSLSTFSSHMTNIVNIIDKADDDSLVLLDELGAGTDPVEGAALAMAILQKFYKKDVMTLSTTHYSELKHYALSRDGFQNASVEFNVETLNPTYRLIIGIPGKSNAFEISRKLGLNEEVIEKAREFVEHTNIEFEDILEKINKNLSEAENDRDEAIRLKIESQKIKEKWDKKNEKLEESRNKVLKQAKDEAKKILMDSKKETEAIIKELRGMNISSKEDNKRIEDMRNQLKGRLSEVSEVDSLKDKHKGQHPKNVSIGDRVKILSLDSDGEVLSKQDKDGNFYVQAGIMKVKVNLSDVILIKTKKNVEATIAKSYSANKKFSIDPEVDLRGMDLEEARMTVDKYIDDAFMAGLDKVQIIHGKGTGVLRKGIKELLKSNRHVKSQRDGIYGEGGMGVTVVELK